MVPTAKKYKFGLALSGGGMRGYAHLGVIKALHEEGFVPEVISGVSAGAIIGAFYADGYAPEEILEIFKERSLFRLINISIRKISLLRMRGLSKILADNLRAKTFSELKIPMYIAAANLNTGELSCFSQGPLLKLLRASSAVPILFHPVKIGNDIYVDGGIISNLPVKPLEDISKIIIGVNTNPLGRVDSFDNLPSIIDRTLHMGIIANVLHNIPKCHIFIEPTDLKKFSVFKSGNEQELFDVGYEYTKELLKKKGQQPGYKTDTSSII